MAHQFGKVRIGELEVSLENGGGDATFISHAHSDHACHERNAKKLIASEETAELIGSGKERVELEGLKLLEAGHILGSRQMSARVDGETLVYTGDFKLEAGLTTKGAEIPRECDTLVIEGTYGEPEAVFPSREEVYSQMERWVKGNRESVLVFGAYETGKAQEIVKFLNEYCGIAPIVSRKIDRVCGVYEKFGVRLERVRAGSKEAAEACRGGFSAVLPVREADEGLCAKIEGVYGRKALCAQATGWAYKRAVSADAVFCLSDHADFKGILEYVQEANPKKIYCTHGNERRLARELSSRGFDAEPLNRRKEERGAMQMKLAVQA